MLRNGTLLSGLIALLTLVTPAVGQCPRAWLPAPNGVYDAPTGSSQVLAMTEWDPDGAGPLPPVLVVGGNFIAAGDQGADYVAYWDGSTWNRLGWGFDAPVRALAVLNGVLYAGGDFTSTGGVAAHYLAYWTGSAWQEAGFGTDARVDALASDGTQLIVGGQFTHEAGGLIAFRYIARFSPGSWDGYLGTLPAPVSSVAVLNGQPVVICNQFDDIDPPRYDQVMYRWTGSQWSAVDYLNYAGTMGVSGGSLFYSTLMLDYGSGMCAHYNEYAIKQFDGASTSISYLYHSGLSFANLNGQLYAMGFSRQICPYNGGGGPEQPWLGSWNGSQWTDSPLSPGLYGGLLGSANGVLYVGGVFDHVYNGNQPVQTGNIARLAGSQWTAMVDGLDAPVTCTGNASTYIGGAFASEGNNALAHGAYWNGQVWVSLGGFNGSLTSMFFYRAFNVIINPSFVASGPFTQLGTIPLNHIGIRDTSNNWTNMGTGIDAPALAMISVPSGVGHNDLIAGGQFITAGGFTANHVARWNGSSWSVLGSGTNGDVHALAYFGGQTIAGGSFTTAGGAAASNIAAWNGSAWSALGSGLNATVRALIVYNGQLIAGGDFTVAGGAAAAHLAAWNGSAWAPFNDGADGAVYAMVVSGTDLIVGGVFTHAGAAGTPANHIADWDGTNWNWVGYNAAVPGGGTDGPVYTLSLSGTTLVAGGSFTHAGPELSPFAALAVTPGDPVVLQQPTDAAACGGTQTSFTYRVGGWFTGIGYSWRHNNLLINDGVNPSGSVYSGTHTSTLNIDNIQYADAGGYSCLATTACNQISFSAAAQLTVGAGCCGSADFNCDGDSATDADIEAFFACIAGNCPPPPCTSTADFNGDGDSATDADIEAFFRVLAGGTC